MFERYTEKARRVIFFARYLASEFGCPTIETEHLLDLLDEAGSRAKLRQIVFPAEVSEIKKRSRFIQERHGKAMDNHEFEKARFYADERKKELANLEAALKKYNLAEGTIAKVTRDDIEQIIAERTGLSIDLLRRSRAEQAEPGR